MINKEIDLNNIIRVSIAETPTALTSDNVNTIAIFTNEPSQYPIDKYVLYKNINGVADMWGIDSKVYKMIYSIFNQSPNITAGQGYVVVFQLKDNAVVEATSGSMTTQNIIYTKFLTVEDGSFGIKVDNNEVIPLQNINFTGCQDLDGIINVLNTNFAENNIDARIYNVDQEIKIVSASSGGQSKIELQSINTTINIGKETLLNVENSVSVDGTDEIPGHPTVPATSGYFKTNNIELNIANFATVTNGAFKIQVDNGEQISFNNIDFTGLADAETLYLTLQTIFASQSVPVTVTLEDDNEIKITSDTTGENSKVIISGDDVLGTTNLAGESYLNVANATVVTGTNEIPAVDPIPATSGKATTTEIDITNFKAIFNGNFKITVNGVESSIDNLNFTTAETLEDIATVLQEKITNATVSVNNTSLVFTSNTTGATSTVILGNGTDEAVGTDLTTMNYFNISKAIFVNGTDGYVGQERLADAVIRCKDYIFFEAILTTYIPSDKEIIETSQTIQFMNKLYFPIKTNLLDLEIFETIKQKRYTKTRCLYYGQPDFLLFSSGYASKLLSVNFDGVNTANNVNNKEIIGLSPDTTIGDSELTILKDIGVDSYCSMRGLGVIQCSGENDWSDSVLFKNWLVNQLQVVAFNTLRTTPTKIPQTEAGVQVLLDNYKQVMYQSVTLGYVAPGTWKGQIAFGNDEELYKNNIEQNGFYIWSIPVSQQSQEQRKKRIAPPCYIALKLAGAINECDITVFIED